MFLLIFETGIMYECGRNSDMIKGQLEKNFWSTVLTSGEYDFHKDYGVGGFLNPKDGSCLLGRAGALLKGSQVYCFSAWCYH